MALKRLLARAVVKRQCTAAVSIRSIRPRVAARLFAEEKAPRKTASARVASSKTRSHAKAPTRASQRAASAPIDDENDQGPLPLPPGPPPEFADPFDHIFNDYTGREELNFQQILMLHGVILQAISGRGPLKCSEKFVKNWSTVLQRFFQEMPDMRRFSHIVASEFDLKQGAWDRDIKYLLWTVATMFGSFSRIYMNTSHLLYQVYRTIEEANSDKPPRSFVAKLSDDTYLPSYAELSEAFGLPSPNPPSKDRAYRTTILTKYFMNRKQAGMDRVASLLAAESLKPELRKPPTPKAIDAMSVGETFQLLDFMEVCFHPYNYFCSRNGHYLFITQELINSLAAHIEKVASRMVANNELPNSRKVPVVVEVGAGNGRLSYFLSQKLGGAVQIKPTDWRKWETDTSADVIVLDQKEAVEKLKPDIVLCSFMPSGVDWPADWRKVKSVKEYILIGETTSGAVGNSWTTFGERRGVDNDPDEGEVPPFEQEGWKKEILHDVSENVLECYDTLDLFGRACAVNFTRGK